MAYAAIPKPPDYTIGRGSIFASAYHLAAAESTEQELGLGGKGDRVKW